jgi:hypothetical protein
MAGNNIPIRFGKLAKEFGYRLPVVVLQSNAGYYLGTMDDEGEQISRESEYFKTQEPAEKALISGGWDQNFIENDYILVKEYK